MSTTKSISETGHNKNAANFSTALQVLQEMATLYNPTNTRIQLTNLTPIQLSLQTTLTTLNTKIPIYKNKVSEREEAIANLNNTITQSLNYTKSIDISTTDKENINNLGKKIRGDKRTKKTNPETATSETISTSQMSYDSRIANFGTYIAQLQSHPQYQPNESAIQITTLQTLHTQLSTLSTQVNTAANELITARTNRNNVLYNNTNNVLVLIKEIKAYLKSLGAPAEPYYKAIVRLQFSPLKE